MVAAKLFRSAHPKYGNRSHSQQCRTFTGDSVLLRFGWSAASICVRTLCLSRTTAVCSPRCSSAGAPPARRDGRIRFPLRRVGNPLSSRSNASRSWQSTLDTARMVRAFAFSYLHDVSVFLRANWGRVAPHRCRVGGSSARVGGDTVSSSDPRTPATTHSFFDRRSVTDIYDLNGLF